MKGGGAIKWEVDPSMAHLSLLHNPIEDSTPDDITDDTYRPTIGGPIRLSGYGPGGSDKAPFFQPTSFEEFFQHSNFN